ncbi:MATE family efflux transporter [Pseudoflavonifractor phocaeensis]|uniref:MATE family efflux transporter n=1 Tax=Pseudoflavonifractor phocaeensis TaxID=1870988 RepID=UPI00195699BE|nr:MATE family efflux transporter [Pseudoflavonifractor phocaeensis]MBM6925555.1 MATE family efflux transporter [Pseudoflavonifractor phocaeensis]
MRRTNDLGKDPVFPLVCRLAIPTMLAQMVSVLYSIVDRMYIGNIPEIGDLALAGVGVCGPIVTLLGSFATLVGLGGSPILAMRMGEGNEKEARRVLSNSFLMLLVLSGVLTTLFLLLKGQLLMWFGASPATFDYANTYLTIYTAGTFFALMATGMNSFLIAQGFSGLGMATVMLGAVLNIVLDPVFIFLLDLGVAGAAIATVISQMASCAFVLCALLRKSMPVPLRWGGFERRIMLRIVTFGLSPFLIIATDSILLIVLNTVLQRYGGAELGDTLVTCATIVQSYLLLITMPMGGLTLGTQPVISFNYGAGNGKRIKTALKSIVGLCLAFCAIMMVVTHTLSPLFVRLFTQNAEVLERSVGYIKVFTAMILPLAVQYPLVDETTALGQVRLALFCSLFRKSVFLACLLLLPALVSAEATFLSEPIADVVAATMTTCLFLRAFPRIMAKRACRP